MSARDVGPPLRRLRHHDDLADDANTNASLIGRLLEEISWEGNRVRHYRRGGLGMENVLTTEVLSPLSYLPRHHFLREVLRAAHGAEAAMASAASEIEDADMFILPPQLTLQPGGVIVQPDAVIESPNSYVLVEAKRIRRASFQPEQLAREYLAVHRQAGRRVPTLLLILGSAPPAIVKRHGPRDILHAIAEHLPPSWPGPGPTRTSSTWWSASRTSSAGSLGQRSTPLSSGSCRPSGSRIRRCGVPSSDWQPR